MRAGGVSRAMTPAADAPEARVRENIDNLLTNTSWIVQSRDQANVTACRGVAIREFPLKSGYGFADYLLYVDGVRAGVVEAKKEGETLTGYEIQTASQATFLHDDDRLIGIVVGKSAEADPAAILTQHGLVEHQSPDGPIAITW